ncbi:MAG: NmrA family transcriptional regulator, partial [Pseudomonas sp.]
PDARSQTTLSHWLSEQVFTWSGVPTTHLRITFFAQWMLYIAPLIRSGKYLTPFDADSRFAPIATRDIAKIIAGVLTNPEPHANKAYVLNGPIEYSHRELAGVIGDTLGKEVRFEQVSPEEFVNIMGLDSDPTYLTHFSAVKIDQQEGRLQGLDTIGSEIIGGPLQTPAQFIEEHRAVLS